MDAKEKLVRGRKTYCINDHEYTEENSFWFTRYVWSESRKAFVLRNVRQCRICLRAAKARHKRKEAALRRRLKEIEKEKKLIHWNEVRTAVRTHLVFVTSYAKSPIRHS